MCAFSKLVLNLANSILSVCGGGKDDGGEQERRKSIFRLKNTQECIANFYTHMQINNNKHIKYYYINSDMNIANKSICYKYSDLFFDNNCSRFSEYSLLVSLDSRFICMIMHSMSFTKNGLI